MHGMQDRVGAELMDTGRAGESGVNPTALHCTALHATDSSGRHPRQDGQSPGVRTVTTVASDVTLESGPAGTCCCCCCCPAVCFCVGIGQFDANEYSSTAVNYL